MRKLYEINRDIEELLNTITDPETGEIVDTDSLDKLFVERDEKIESVILYEKDVDADIAAITHEIMNLQNRVDRLKNTREGLRTYIAKALDGHKFRTSRCDVGWRKSEAVEVDDDFCEWASNAENLAIHYLTKKESVTPNKAEIKKFLKSGGTLEHCRLIEKQNMTIK